MTILMTVLLIAGIAVGAMFSYVLLAYVVYGLVSVFEPFLENFIGPVFESMKLPEKEPPTEKEMKKLKLLMFWAWPLMIVFWIVLLAIAAVARLFWLLIGLFGPIVNKWPKQYVEWLDKKPWQRQKDDIFEKKPPPFFEEF